MVVDLQHGLESDVVRMGVTIGLRDPRYQVRKRRLQPPVVVGVHPRGAAPFARRGGTSSALGCWHAAVALRVPRRWHACYADGVALHQAVGYR